MTPSILVKEGDSLTHLRDSYSAVLGLAFAGRVTSHSRVIAAHEAEGRIGYRREIIVLAKNPTSWSKNYQHKAFFAS